MIEWPFCSIHQEPMQLVCVGGNWQYVCQACQKASLAHSVATEYEWICPACGTSILVKTSKQSKAIGIKLSVCPVCGKEVLYGKAD